MTATKSQHDAALGLCFSSRDARGERAIRWAVQRIKGADNVDGSMVCYTPAAAQRMARFLKRVGVAYEMEACRAGVGNHGGWYYPASLLAGEDGRFPSHGRAARMIAQITAAV